MEKEFDAACRLAQNTDTASRGRSMNTLTADQETKRQRLLAWMEQLSSCAVAMSAGVDSSVVAMAAHVVLGERAVAVTGDSPSLPREELEMARQVARQIGIRHHVVTTSELNTDAYRRNEADRCFHCKSELYRHMVQLAPTLGVEVLLNGANLDDLGDYRPGMQAAREFQVRSPLVDCELGKSDVRALAAAWGLPTWDKPAAPCLSSRLAYGLEVTAERLQRVEQGEAFLRSLGLREFRLRYHHGDLARIEVPSDQIVRLSDPDVRQQVIERLQSFGFRYVTLDLVGFRSGSLNRLIPVESLTAGSHSS